MRSGVWALVALFAACSSSLPSAEPLGTGPLAERGDAAVKLTKASDAGAPDVAVSEPEAPETPPETTVASAAGDAAPEAAAPTTTADKGEAHDAGSKPAATAAIDGEYTGSDTTTYRLPNAPETPQKDPNAKTRVTKKSGDSVEIVIINSSNGQDLCKLTGKLKGSTVTLDKGQHCFDEGGATASLRKGTAKFSGKRLVLDLEFDLEIDTGQDTLKGEIIYHFEGDRK